MLVQHYTVAQITEENIYDTPRYILVQQFKHVSWELRRNIHAVSYKSGYFLPGFARKKDFPILSVCPSYLFRWLTKGWRFYIYFTYIWKKRIGASDDLQRSLPNPTILWFCDSVILWFIEREKPSIHLVPVSFRRISRCVERPFLLPGKDILDIAVFLLCGAASIWPMHPATSCAVKGKADSKRADYTAVRRGDWVYEGKQRTNP